MTIRPTALAALGLAAFGLAACDSADGPAAPETATGVFDAALFPDADQLYVVSNQAADLMNDRVIRYRQPESFNQKAAFFRQSQYDATSFQQATALNGVEAGFGFTNGTNYVGSFDGDTGGFLALFSRRGAELDRTADGDLASPKGFDILRVAGDDTISDLYVADFGTGEVYYYFAEELSSGIQNSFTSPRSSSVWDVDYDLDTNLIFVARTDGFVSVYTFFGDPADEFQVFGADGSPAVNNHGIEYDFESRTLIVSDVGLAGSPDDGAIHVLDYNPISRVSLLDGSALVDADTPITARATYAGANTMLGNPVDIAGSGSDLFVAEKANQGGRMLRFDDVLTATGTLNVAPSSMDASVRNPESVKMPSEPFGSGDGERLGQRSTFGTRR